MTIDSNAKQLRQVAMHAALTDHVRLMVVDALCVADQFPTEDPPRAAHPPRSGQGRPPTPTAAALEHPRRLTDVLHPGDVVIAVCDLAHEELTTDPTRMHRSVADPVPVGDTAAFDHAQDDLTGRITRLAPPSTNPSRKRP